MNATTTSSLALAVISGGLSEESATHRLADALTKATRERLEAAGVDVIVKRVDVRELAHELASASLTGFASGTLSAAYEALGRADGVIAVTPTYKASYPGLFKAFWDVTPDGAIAGVPVVVAATGGTPRHSLVTDTAMRPLFAYMKAPTMPTAVYAAAEDWGDPGLARRVGEAADELAATLTNSGHRPSSPTTAANDPSPNQARTLADTRDRARNPFVGVPTMEQMLHG